MAVLFEVEGAEGRTVGSPSGCPPSVTADCSVAVALAVGLALAVALRIGLAVALALAVLALALALDAITLERHDFSSEFM
jgi:hypothetical protein